MAARATRRQVFHPGELPLVLLAMVEDQPRSPASLIAQLNRALGPLHRASPGAVYPALSALVAEGLVSSAGGRGSLYELADAGRRALEQRRLQLAAFEERTQVRIGVVQELDVALNSFVTRVRDLSSRSSRPDLIPLLEKFLHEIESEENT